jgi:phosphatidate cytidylyltransferase
MTAPATDTPPTSPSGHGRAGRNLPVAIGVGVALGGSVLALLFGFPPGFLVLMLLAIGLGIVEVVRATDSAGYRVPLTPLLAGCLACVLAAYLSGPDALVVAITLTIVGVVLWRMGEGSRSYLADVSVATFTAVYLPLLAGFAALMLAPSDGPRRVATFISTVVANDVGGYAAGVLFGKHPMAPSVSPKKSWEGLAGSVAACALAGGLLVTLLLHGTWWQGVVFGVAMCATATLGDLGESMIKRDLGIKDMGTLLPGHGGVMDRLDSLLPSAPIAYLLLAAFIAAG